MSCEPLWNLWGAAVSFFLMARRHSNVLRFGVSKSLTGSAKEEIHCYDRYEDELQRRRIIACLLFGGMTAL